MAVASRPSGAIAAGQRTGGTVRFGARSVLGGEPDQVEREADPEHDDEGQLAYSSGSTSAESRYAGVRSSTMTGASSSMLNRTWLSRSPDPSRTTLV
jgi:hypothetical protein